MGERPPVRAVLERVAVHASVAKQRQQRRPLIDGHAGVVGLHELRARRPSRDRTARRRARSRCRARSGARGCAIRARSIARSRRRSSSGSAWCSAAVRRAPRLRETLRRARRSPSSGARGRTRDRSARGSWLQSRLRLRRAIGDGSAEHASQSIAWLPRSARELDQARAATRQRAPARSSRCDLLRPDMLVHAVAAEHQHLAVAELDARRRWARSTAPLPTIRAGSSGEPPGGGRLAEMAVGVVARQQLRRLVGRRAHAIDAAIADPRDQPARQQMGRSRRTARPWPRRRRPCARRWRAPPRGRRRAARRDSESRVDAAPVERARAACGPARGSPTKPSRRRRRRRRRRRPAPAGRARCTNPRSRAWRLPRPDATASSSRAHARRRAPPPRVTVARSRRAPSRSRRRRLARRHELMRDCLMAARDSVSVHSRFRADRAPEEHRLAAAPAELRPWRMRDAGDASRRCRHARRPSRPPRRARRCRHGGPTRPRAPSRSPAPGCASGRCETAAAPRGARRALAGGHAHRERPCRSHAARRRRSASRASWAPAPRGAIGVAGAPSSPAVRSSSRGYCDGSPRASAGQHDARAGHHFDHRRCAPSWPAFAPLRPSTLPRRLDPNAVGRPAVGHPPRAVVEPDLAVPPARVLAVDDDVAALAVADRVAAARNDGRAA